MIALLEVPDAVDDDARQGRYRGDAGRRR
jgi:hypothetical protein